ncbi:protease modulator HflK, partial [Pseudomonas edaphica]|nr:protease modulator HflK [Pseudomonas edaphica]
MQVDLEADGASVEGLPRFQQGLFHARRLRQAGISLTALALAGWVLALFVALFAPLSIWPVVLINCASALLVLVAGLQSAWWVADWRAQALETPTAELIEAPDEEVGALVRAINRFGSGVLAQIGAPVLWLCGWSLLALISIIEFWNLALPAA